MVYYTEPYQSLSVFHYVVCNKNPTMTRHLPFSYVHLFNCLLNQISNQSPNHTGAPLCFSARRHGQGSLLRFKLSIRYGKKVVLSDFEHGVVASARRYS